MTSVGTTEMKARPQEVAPVGGGGAGGRRGGGGYAAPLLGLAAFFLIPASLSGLGDAPAPHQSAELMAAHFQDVSDSVVAAAPLGSLAAVAVAAFLLAVASRLHRVSQQMAAAAVVAGGLLTAGYLLFIHVVYTSLADSVAVSSAEATKAMFVSTILAVPVFGLGISVALGAAAYGANRSRLLPAWWSVVSAAGSVIAAISVFSYARNGFFSPDVQQQVSAAVLQVWLLMTTVVLVLQHRKTSHHPQMERPS